MTAVKRIGLFGGTFNPIHFGHIHLALELKEKKELDGVWFIPSLLSPLRTPESIVTANHRIKMLELTLADIPGFELCTLELNRLPPSYTIDTIREILTAYPQHAFSLLFGEDSLLRFGEWKEPDEIVRLIPLLVGSRRHSELLEKLPKLGFSERITRAIEKGIVPTKQLEISATSIRERLKKNLYCRHLLPGKVLDYIYENQLYYNV